MPNDIVSWDGDILSISSDDLADVIDVQSATVTASLADYSIISETSDVFKI